MATPYILILAGGSGTRFWPLSRNSKPKQLLDLFGTGTLLNQTIDRLEGLAPKENIFILTNQLQIDEVRRLAADLPPENIVAEPAKRDTAPAVALGIGLIAARDPEATMVVLPSDQLITDVDAFRSVLSDAITTASNSDALVTVGIKPTWACPSYGYIELGETSSEFEVTHKPREVKRFREKPSPEVAEEFLSQGGFTWNAGMFIWSIKTVTNELTKHTPELSDFINKFTTSSNHSEIINEDFPKLSPISIDFALMEKASRVLNIEATFDWDDVGSWISVAKYLDQVGDNNATNTPLVEIDASNNIIFGAREKSQISLLGIKNTIIVQTDDALLVADRAKADDIKKIVDKLEQDLL